MVVLSNVTSRDTGNYECRGSNSLGSDSATRYVRIRGTVTVRLFMVLVLNLVLLFIIAAVCASGHGLFFIR